jgi:hypothetical protein
MAIEAFYPSRCQSQANNPLFNRRRKSAGLAASCILAALGAAGLCLAQTAPIAAAANDMRGPSTAPQPARADLAETTSKPPFVQGPVARKPVRVIPIYEIPADAAGTAHSRS